MNVNNGTIVASADPNKVEWEDANNGTIFDVNKVEWLNVNNGTIIDTSASVDCSGTNVLLGNGTCIATVLLDVFVDTTGDTMTGDLNLSESNITINFDTGRYCLTQDCSSYIYNNGTHSIWK